MPDYYALISGAVARTGSYESRRRVYERARKLQLAQLHRFNPPLSDSEIKRELYALEDAIQNVEHQVASRSQATETKGRSSDGAPLRNSYNSNVRRTMAVLMAGVIMLQTAFLVWLIANPVPSTEQLDADLNQVRVAIKQASSESEKYGPSAIKAIVEARRQILLNTESMLLQKRTSALRRINLNFEFNGSGLRPETDNELNSIKAEIDQAKQKLAVSVKNANQYTGGLVQAMALMSVQTDELTISQLWLKFYSAKYGLPFFFKVDNAANQPAPAPGNVVKDRDAL